MCSCKDANGSASGDDAPVVRQGLVGLLLLSLIRFYQAFISPLLAARCRFTPNCSAYGAEAIRKYGPRKGGLMALRRFFSCHPWGRSGYDPVK